MNQTASEQRRALVTGVSGPRGIGAAVCRQLASQGVSIAYSHYQADPVWLTAWEEELRSHGIRSLGIEANLADPEAPARLLNEAEAGLGGLHILVNSAAHSTRGSYLELDAEALDAHHAVNVRAVCLLSADFARRYESRGERSGGRIINLTSGQGQGPMPGELAYVASKGAIAAFSVTLAAEVGRLGITVNAVNPGPTDTTWMDDGIRSALLPLFPFGRIGQPEDAARLIGFLASEEGQWITGQILHSEGGFARG